MTKAHSEPDDNGGRCESCNRPETIHQTQQTYPIMLGGGLGLGTLWLCPNCHADHMKRLNGKPAGHEPLKKPATKGPTSMTTIYIGNLPYSATEEELKNLFAPRAINRVTLVTDKETGKPRGFGFVEFGSVEEAESAIANFDGSVFGKRTLKISMARERQKSTGGGGGVERRDHNKRGGGGRRGEDYGWNK